MEDGRAEQRAPAERGGSSVEHVEVAGASVLLDVEHAGADEAELHIRLQQREAAVEPVREGDVVGVHAGDVATSRFLEPAVQRPRQAKLLLVAQHAQPRVVDAVEERGRVVGREVVDDEQLEVGDALAKDAVERSAEEALAVVDGDQHGDQWRRHGVP